MRLNSIKLAGFKSFVDPTQLIFQSNLTAVVGPNGCGKSNIVDAIHCVLGSTSKNLRAELMSDVIFNGANGRKPVGQASIELVFDNSDARVGGEYAQYPEISIRRELNRDGQSNYYLNSVRCRRRDITDIFLGTGLGNNSYAIIEQGMISRLIEAKPEELRAHVEEAAGTSKYKERRRETENRIKHTRENLDRLSDLRDEQAKQLSHLQRQANAAEKFKALKTEQRLFKAQLQVILWQGLQEQIASYTQKITLQETALEAKIAEHRNVDKEIELKRSLRVEHNDLVNDIQSQYYGLGAEINGVEQNINHAKERKRQLEKDYEQLEQSYQELHQQQFEDQNQLEQLNHDISKVELAFQESTELAKTLHVDLKLAEEHMHDWQERWDDFNQHSAQTSKHLEVEKTKIQHLEQKKQSLCTRLARLKEEQDNHDSENVAQEVLHLTEQQRNSQLSVAAFQEQYEVIQENIHSDRVRYQEAQQEVGRLIKELRDLQAKHASLQAMQQIALGKNDVDTKTWLDKNHLHELPRLAEGLDVELGWEVAVETVLANYLDAICIDDFTPLVQSISDLPNVDVSFFNSNASIKSTHATKQLASLKDKIHSPWSMLGLLANIYVADSLHHAFEILPQLDSNESIVTRDGIWLSATWLKVTRSISEKTGVVQREHDLKELHQQIVQLQNTVSKQEAFYQEAQEQLNLNIESRENIGHQLQSEKAKNSDYLAQIKAKQSFIQQLQQKQTSVLAELSEIQQHLIEVEEALTTATASLASLGELNDDIEAKRHTLLAQRELLRSKLDSVRQNANVQQQRADESQIRMESMRSQVHYLTQNLIRVERQLSTISERRKTISESLNNNNDPLPELNVVLQQALEKRAIIEDELTKAKQALSALEDSLQQLEKNRQQIENSSHEIRNGLEELRLECQSFRVKMSTYTEQIQEAGFELEQVQQQLPEEARVDTWEEQLIKIDNRIQRLGPINLAAIDEFASLSERKDYLDRQHNDLIEALTTLENAIRKIDKETRIRFKETFMQLNDSFKTYFQQIFGGGEATLELTSDDLLETGVIVKAQPPGKRNSTIHLLSGGEKALTAIALVFAIFSLNPAPFCVLDEVDAPLDDVNVGRFCNLVRKMAEKIQFIFISHNKITIEMGQQLAGVTMNEPGVSRLVSVDVEQAISMANA
ncbi:MAG: chromosome segregation protein SMC [Gammaproteobacteria bacterium]|nr:chromosome segregation protein SMC [Gammaproteobacteria bacterium]